MASFLRKVQNTAKVRAVKKKIAAKKRESKMLSRKYRSLIKSESKRLSKKRK